MAVEPRRGCGYRKIGGLYLCAKAPNALCCQFPIPLRICPTCNQGVKQSRGVTWFEPDPWLHECDNMRTMCSLRGHVGKSLLIWIGAKYYGTPEHFLDETKRLGISRRIKVIPRGFKLGETKVFFAHPDCTFLEPSGKVDCGPGLFAMVVPDRFELIVTDQPTVKQKKRLEDERVTPIVVPAHDPDHNYHTVEDPDFEELWNETAQAGAN